MRKVFFMNSKVFLNAFECYSDCHLMWMVSLKKRNDILTLMRKKGFVMVIVEKEQTVLDNLHLIWVYYRSHYIHAQFQPSEI